MFKWIIKLYERFWKKTPPPEMKKLKVYVWRPSGQNVGHSSMLLPDGTYISWWPDGECSQSSITRTAEPHTSFQEDADIEGDPNPPTFSIDITEEQMQDIKAWWEEYKEDKENKYNITDNNCSTVIYKALKQAFPKLNCFDEKIQVWVPLAVQLIIQDLAAGEDDFTEEKITEYVKQSEDEATQIASNGGIKSKYITVDKIRKVVDKVESGAKKVVQKKTS